jgi:hypothetical protein
LTTEKHLRRCQRRRLGLLSALWLSAYALSAGAQNAPLTALQIALQPLQQLVRNAHAPIAVLVQLPNASKELPLLLTPRIEGDAVELVRGRLMRSDAKQADATHLRFEIPVVARSEGTAILRVSVSTYLCDESCRRIEATTSAVLEVR